MDLRDLQLAFHDHAAWYRNPRGKRACWLWQFDDRHHACAGRLEAIHLIGRQRVRNRLFGVDPEIVEQAEWDPRNAALGCTLHHRRFDSHATPPLRVPIYALRRQALDFIADYGLESDAEAKFTGNLDLALAMPKASDRCPTVPVVARVQPGHISAGQPSAVSRTAA
jgi:hypothetical protein